MAYASLSEVLDLALNQNHKIEAIKLVRERGFAGPGYFNNAYVDEPKAGCPFPHEYRDGDQGYGAYMVGYGGRCNDTLSLMDAKELVERLMAKATGLPYDTQAGRDLILKLQMTDKRNSQLEEQVVGLNNTVATLLERLDAETPVALELTQREASVLHFILEAVGGDPNGPRGQADSIWSKLNAYGVKNPLDVAYADSRIAIYLQEAEK